MARLTSRFLIDLLIRQTQAAGGFATILAKGDDQSGVILVQCRNRGEAGPLLERRFTLDGGYEWEEAAKPLTLDGELADYHERRRKSDPDLWLIELDVADAPRLVAEWALLA